MQSTALEKREAKSFAQHEISDRVAQFTIGIISRDQKLAYSVVSDVRRKFEAICQK